MTVGMLFDRHQTPLIVWMAVSSQCATAIEAVASLRRNGSGEIVSDETAWAMLHRLSLVPVRPGRHRLTGTGEVGETCFGGGEGQFCPPLRGGRQKGKEIPVGVGVELRAPREFRHCHMALHANASGVRLGRARSTGHHGSRSVYLMGALPPERLPGHGVDSVFDQPQVCGVGDREVGAFADVATEEPGPDLVGGPLQGRMRLAGEDLGPREFSEFTVSGHLAPLGPTKCPAQLNWDASEDLHQGAECRLGPVVLGEVGHPQVAARPVEGGDDHRWVHRPADEVAFEVPDLGPSAGDCGPGADEVEDAERVRRRRLGARSPAVFPTAPVMVRSLVEPLGQPTDPTVTANASPS